MSETIELVKTIQEYIQKLEYQVCVHEETIERLQKENAYLQRRIDEDECT